jgi:hypothetical protein
MGMTNETAATDYYARGRAAHQAGLPGVAFTDGVVRAAVLDLTNPRGPEARAITGAWSRGYQSAVIDAADALLDDEEPDRERDERFREYDGMR